jgi:cyclase
LVANLRRAYAEELGEPLGVHLPSAPAFADMVAYNGGRPLTCLA